MCSEMIGQDRGEDVIVIGDENSHLVYWLPVLLLSPWFAADCRFPSQVLALSARPFWSVTLCPLCRLRQPGPGDLQLGALEVL